ncbi:hypothetical protein HMPREF1154_1525 [Capnocytophaga sp. CM59]|nr:hypothetical protein HMPREF1154_1525 [Capnocytophaga sp. CM59]
MVFYKSYHSFLPLGHRQRGTKHHQLKSQQKLEAIGEVLF